MRRSPNLYGVAGDARGAIHRLHGGVSEELRFVVLGIDGRISLFACGFGVVGGDYLLIQRNARVVVMERVGVALDVDEQPVAAIQSAAVVIAKGLGTAVRS